MISTKNNSITEKILHENVLHGFSITELDIFLPNSCSNKNYMFIHYTIVTKCKMLAFLVCKLSSENCWTMYIVPRTGMKF